MLQYESVGGRLGTAISLEGVAGSWECLSYATLILTESDFSIIKSKLFIFACI